MIKLDFDPVDLVVLFEQQGCSAVQSACVDKIMIADNRCTKKVGMERTINGRKIPSGTWLLEKLGLCNCCPKARCVFILIEARTLLGLSSRLLHVTDFLTDAHLMHEGFSLLLISATHTRS